MESEDMRKGWKNNYGIRAVVLLMISCLVLGCFHTESMAKVQKAKTIKAVALEIAKKKVTGKTYKMKVGDKKKLKVYVSSTTKGKKTLQYVSDNKKVAVINKSGMITAKKVGTCKIKVTVSAKGYKKKMVWVRIKIEKGKEQKNTATQVPTMTPEATAVPETPETTATPKVTETPEATKMPEIIATPEVTETPEVTKTPEITATQEVTKTPEITATPEMTKTPEITATPEVTKTPEITATPEETTTPGPSQTPDNSQIKKSIVVYFSCTDNTKKIAEYVAESAGATIYRIEAADPYTSADLNYNNAESRTSKENRDATARPEIAGVLPDLDEYDTIYIGYPIWWGQAPKIMYTFVENYSLSGKTIVPFCTSASSGIGTSATNLQKVATGQATWMDGQRFSGSSSKEQVEKWVMEMDLK